MIKFVKVLEDKTEIDRERRLVYATPDFRFVLTEGSYSEMYAKIEWKILYVPIKERTEVAKSLAEGITKFEAEWGWGTVYGNRVPSKAAITEIEYWGGAEEVEAEMEAAIQQEEQERLARNEAENAKNQPGVQAKLEAEMVNVEERRGGETARESVEEVRYTAWEIKGNSLENRCFGLAITREEDDWVVRHVEDRIPETRMKVKPGVNPAKEVQDWFSGPWMMELYAIPSEKRSAEIDRIFEEFKQRETGVTVVKFSKKRDKIGHPLYVSKCGRYRIEVRPWKGSIDHPVYALFDGEKPVFAFPYPTEKPDRVAAVWLEEKAKVIQ